MESFATPSHVVAYLAMALYIVLKDVLPWARNRKNGNPGKNSTGYALKALNESVDRGFTRMDDWIHGHEEFTKRQIEEFATNKAERQEIFRRIENLEKRHRQ